MSKRDLDIEMMGLVQLKNELQALRDDLRPMAAAQGHDLCHYWPSVFRHLPEYVEQTKQIPPVCEFMGQCAAFRTSLGGVTPLDMLAAVERLRDQLIIDYILGRVRAGLDRQPLEQHDG